MKQFLIITIKNLIFILSGLKAAVCSFLRRKSAEVRGSAPKRERIGQRRPNVRAVLTSLLHAFLASVVWVSSIGQQVQIPVAPVAAVSAVVVVVAVQEQAHSA